MLIRLLEWSRFVESHAPASLQPVLEMKPALLEIPTAAVAGLLPQRLPKAKERFLHQILFVVLGHL
jgi:hypothetical protein